MSQEESVHTKESFKTFISYFDAFRWIIFEIIAVTVLRKQQPPYYKLTPGQKWQVQIEKKDKEIKVVRRYFSKIKFILFILISCKKW